ncbi:MAG: outer membrane beta-barrel protein [Chlamydiales bacterium]|nr:outer membrane beta-barrel protein [Chlamydiales bacterium]
MAQGSEGFYVGGSVGVSGTIARQQGEMLAQYGFIDPRVFPMDLKTDFFRESIEGTLFAGYGVSRRSLYVGFEGFIRCFQPKFSIHKQHLHDELPLQFFDRENTSYIEIDPWHYGIDGRIGYFIKPSLLFYGRFGFELTRIDLANKSILDGLSLTDTFSITLSPSKCKRSAYLRVGVGLEQDLSDRLSLRADYLYTDYRNISVDDQTTGISLEGNFLTLADHTDLNLKNHALSLGLSYHFSNAQPCCLSECHHPHFCGIYLGGGLGGSIFDGKISGEPGGGIVGFFTAPISYDLTPSPHLVKCDWLGTLQLGYGLQWRSFYLGLEFFGRYSQASRTLQDTFIFARPALNRLSDLTSKTAAKIDPWQFGFDARPGLLLSSSTLFFAAIGTSRASLEGHSMGRFILMNPDGFVELERSKKAKRATLRLGGGMEYALNSCWHLRADYRYINYGSLQLKGFAESTQEDVTLSLVEDTRIRLRTHDVTLGLIRYF